mmetsp:Transcript_42563/g.112319  ORF Transcript_42563/g.112319 Transcript_42563/m.112319 type:complete len:148 (-) Transcript_42563:24-467(-)
MMENASSGTAVVPSPKADITRVGFEPVGCCPLDCPLRLQVNFTARCPLECASWRLRFVADLVEARTEVHLTLDGAEAADYSAGSHTCTLTAPKGVPFAGIKPVSLDSLALLSVALVDASGETAAIDIVTDVRWEKGKPTRMILDPFC